MKKRQTSSDESETAGPQTASGSWLDEVILLRKVAKFWNQQDWFDRPDGQLIVTNRCLIFVRQGQTTSSLCFPLAALENLRTGRIMLISPAIRFDFMHQTYVFTFLWNANAVLKTISSARQCG